MLAPKKGFYMAGGVMGRGGQGNAFMYTDRVQDQDIKRVLDEIKIRLSKMTTQDIKDPYQTGKLTGPDIFIDLKIQAMNDIANCLRH